MWKSLNKVVALTLTLSLIFEQSGFAQGPLQIQLPAYINGYVAMDRFRPVQLRSLSFDPVQQNFKLFLDKGDQIKIDPGQITKDAKLLMQYFRIGLALPNDTFWVNLRPDAADQIIDPFLEKTDVGQVMLATDLQLKKDLAGLTSPNTEEGRLYWDKLYAKANTLFDAQEISIPTVTRPWIVPGEVIVRETNSGCHIFKASLKVCLEQDYIKDSKDYKFDDPRLKELNDFSSQLIRELIIPKLTREVNSSKKYASLRQVYYSLILAQWFKEKYRGQKGEYAQKIDGFDLNGLTSAKSWNKEKYFNAYKKSFKKGEYNLSENRYTVQGSSIRQYFSGGEKLIDTLPPVSPGFPGASLDGGSVAGLRIQDESAALDPAKLDPAGELVQITDAGVIVNDRAALSSSEAGKDGGKARAKEVSVGDFRDLVDSEAEREAFLSQYFYEHATVRGQKELATIILKNVLAKFEKSGKVDLYRLSETETLFAIEAIKHIIDRKEIAAKSLALDGGTQQQKRASLLSEERKRELLQNLGYVAFIPANKAENAGGGIVIKFNKETYMKQMRASVERSFGNKAEFEEFRSFVKKELEKETILGLVTLGFYRMVKTNTADLDRALTDLSGLELNFKAQTEQVKDYIRLLENSKGVSPESERAAEMLGKLGDQSARETLKNYLVQTVLGDRPDIYPAAETALRQLGLNDSDFEKVYLDAFTNTKNHTLIRLRALRLLGKKYGKSLSLAEILKYAKGKEGQAGDFPELMKDEMNHVFPKIFLRAQKEESFLESGAAEDKQDGGQAEIADFENLLVSPELMREFVVKAFPRDVAAKYIPGGMIDGSLKRALMEFKKAERVDANLINNHTDKYRAELAIRFILKNMKKDGGTDQQEIKTYINAFVADAFKIRALLENDKDLAQTRPDLYKSMLQKNKNIDISSLVEIARALAPDQEFITAQIIPYLENKAKSESSYIQEVISEALPKIRRLAEENKNNGSGLQDGGSADLAGELRQLRQNTRLKILLLSSGIEFKEMLMIMANLDDVPAILKDEFRKAYFGAVQALTKAGLRGADLQYALDAIKDNNYREYPFYGQLFFLDLLNTIQWAMDFIGISKIQEFGRNNQAGILTKLLSRSDREQVAQLLIALMSASFKAKDDPGLISDILGEIVWLNSSEGLPNIAYMWEKREDLSAVIEFLSAGNREQLLRSTQSAVIFSRMLQLPSGFAAVEKLISVGQENRIEPKEISNLMSTVLYWGVDADNLFGKQVINNLAQQPRKDNLEFVSRLLEQHQPLTQAGREWNRHQELAELQAFLRPLDEKTPKDGGEHRGMDLMDHEAVGKVIERLKNESSSEREKAARQLGEMSAKQAVPDLKEALKTEKVRNVRNTIAYALAKIDKSSLVDMLEGNSLSPYARNAAEMALSELKRNQADGGDVQAFADSQIMDVSAVPDLVKFLSHPNSLVRQGAAGELERLGELTPERELVMLVEDLSDSDSKVRSAAADKLDRSNRLTEQLKIIRYVADLSDPDSDVRLTAAFMFGKIGNPQTLEPLLLALKDHNEFVRIVAAASLEKIRDKKSAEKDGGNEILWFGVPMDIPQELMDQLNNAVKEVLASDARLDIDNILKRSSLEFAKLERTDPAYIEANQVAFSDAIAADTISKLVSLQEKYGAEILKAELKQMLSLLFLEPEKTDIIRLALARIDGSSSSEVNTGDNNAFDGGTNKAPDTTGGIDFRALPVAFSAGSAVVPVAGAAMPRVSLKELGDQWKEIQHAAQNAELPYERMKQFVSCCKIQEEAAVLKQEVTAYVVNLLKLEEERAISTPDQLKEIVALVAA